MIVQYNKKLIFWAFLLCLSASPVFAGNGAVLVGGEEEEEEVVQAQELMPPHRRNVFLRLVAPTDTEAAQALMGKASSKTRANIAKGDTETQEKLQVAAAIKMTYNDKEKAKGFKVLRTLAGQRNGEAARFLVQSGDERAQYLKVVAAQAGSADTEGWVWSMQALRACSAGEAQQQADSLLNDALIEWGKSGAGTARKAQEKRQRQAKNIKNAIIEMINHPNEDTQTHGIRLKEYGMKIGLYSTGDKIKDKLKQVVSKAHEKIAPVPAKP